MRGRVPREPLRYRSHEVVLELTWFPPCPPAPSPWLLFPICESHLCQLAQGYASGRQETTLAPGIAHFIWSFQSLLAPTLMQPGALE